MDAKLPKKQSYFAKHMHILRLISKMKFNCEPIAFLKSFLFALHDFFFSS